MTIKAVLRDGQIKPLEPLPSEWADGQELVIEPDSAQPVAEIEKWANELESLTSSIPSEEHELLDRVLEENERESKDAVRRKWVVE